MSKKNNQDHVTHRHPDDPKSSDYFRPPHHVQWPLKTRRETADVMSSQYAERDKSDPFIKNRMFSRIVQGVGHLDDYTFGKDSMVRYA